MALPRREAGLSDRPGGEVDLGFLEEGARIRAARARRRRRLALAVSAAITLVWAIYVTVAGHWERVVDNWVAAITMVFGSFVAGSTPQGGGAVAFPVFTKGLEIPAEVARTFSLAIQTVGMGAATAAIVINRRRVEWRAVAIGLPVAVATFLAAVVLLGDGGRPFRPSIIPGPYVKVSFTLVVASMALVTYLGSRVRVREVQHEIPAVNARTYATLVAVAAVGGLAAALTGSGADVFVYIYLAVLLAVDARVGVPTSVVVMAGVSLAGFVALGLIDGQLAVTLGSGGESVVAVGGRAVFDAGVGGAVRPEFGTGAALAASQTDLFGLWIAAAPVVAWGAPVGSWAASRLTTRQLVAFAAALALAEIVTTAIFLPELYRDPALAAYAVGGALVLGLGLWWLAANRRRFFGLPGVALDRALSRGHLDVASDYREALEGDRPEDAG